VAAVAPIKPLGSVAQVVRLLRVLQAPARHLLPVVLPADLIGG